MSTPLSQKKEAVKLAYAALNEAIQEYEAELAYIELNNLYLDIQRGVVKLTKTVYFKLNDLLNSFEKHGSQMYDWWIHEFWKLPGWLDV